MNSVGVILYLLFQVIVTNSGSSPSSLLVRLPVSLQDVPPVLIDANSGQTSSLLQVVYQSVRNIFLYVYTCMCG